MTQKQQAPGTVFLFLFLVVFGLSFSLTGEVYGQDPGLGSTDLSTVKSADISDEQLKSYIKRGEAEGLKPDEAFNMARQRGLPASEAYALQRRIRELQSGGETVSQEPETRRDTFEADTLSFIDTRPRVIVPRDDTNIFGSRLFARAGLAFGPSFNIPTPVNYVLGSGDELIVDIWGNATNFLQLDVSPEGTVSIDNLGPVYVHGLTIEEASELIIEKLQQLYRGLRPGSDNQTTFARVRLGRVRSIQVTLIGEVTVPGNYTVSSLSTIFNVLYNARGPNEIGSYRDIQVIRGNKTVATFDMYDFLIKGDQTDNIRLHDQDIVKISPYKTRVEIKGQVKRPGFYEMMVDETMEDLIQYTGNFTDSAFTKSLRVHRNTSTEREIKVVDNSNFDGFGLQNGDVVFVGQLLDRFENRVTIKGAVWRPGEYELTENMSLHDLLMEAEGVRPDAFLSRGIINRLTDNFDFSVVAFDVSRVLNDPGSNHIPLENGDQIVIRDIHEMRQDRTVSIRGEVQKSGDFKFRDNMTLEDLILKAEGFRESASEARIEVYRRIIGEAAPDSRGNQLTESFMFEVSHDLTLRESDTQFELMPFDQVYVRRRPDYQVQQNVTVQGQVLYPGGYALRTRDERISDILQRAGGITNEAYVAGATLVRMSEELERVETELDTVSQDVIIEASGSTGFIGIDMEAILANPGSEDDLILRPGDEIRIPSEMQTVHVTGAVLRDTEVRHMKGRSLNYYVNRAGGLSENALKRKAYVVYANGDVDTRSSFLFFRSNPEIEPGAEIIIPHKRERERMSTGERISVFSSMVSMAAVVVTAISRL